MFITVKVTIFPAEMQAQATHSGQEENPPAKELSSLGAATDCVRIIENNEEFLRLF